MPNHVLVLVARPGALDGAAVRDAVEHFKAGELGAKRWLAPAEACEIAFEMENGGDAARIREGTARARSALGERPIDVAVVSAADRRKKLLVADMESTMIAEECLDELAGIAGVRDKVAPITARAMRGEIPFDAALRARVALLAGMGEDMLARVLAGVTPTPGSATLVRTMRREGAFAALVSGGFSYFAAPVAARFGFDIYRANTLAVANGKLTGDVARPILDGAAKRRVLVDCRARLGLSPAATLAVGDGANDIPMIEAAGLGVAFRAKAPVAAKAHAAIVHGDLTALLYLQGYRREEFAD